MSSSPPRPLRIFSSYFFPPPPRGSTNKKTYSLVCHPSVCQYGQFGNNIKNPQNKLHNSPNIFLAGLNLYRGVHEKGYLSYSLFSKTLPK